MNINKKPVTLPFSAAANTLTQKKTQVGENYIHITGKKKIHNKLAEL